MTEFDLLYQKILKSILTDGIREVNRRTGLEVAALPGLSFSIDLEKDGFPLLTLRKIPLKMFIAEQVWFISGSRKPADFLRKHTKIWDVFTNPGDVVTVAYGYRWRKHFGRDQLGKLIAMLEEDPSSRHGVIITWDPAADGLGGVLKKNVPCPYTFTVNIMNGRLNLHNIIRSNDMVLGAPADAAGFALLAHILADRLGVRPGTYTHSVSHAHIYSNHYAGAKEIVRRKNSHKPIRLHIPAHAYVRAEKKDDSLVEEIFKDLSSQYSPLEPIQGLTIAL
ncbi:thymidylate synthase [bacterium]|nr:thymidylate synthase [bacterium]